MVKWKDEVEKLKEYILKDKLSYEKIGKIYGCSGSNIRKVISRLGIPIEHRRRINPNETFNKGVKLKHKEKYFCKYCGKEFSYNPSGKNIYCSNKCQRDFEYEQFISKWKNGLISGNIGKYSVSNRIRRYLFEKFQNKCQICGWGEENKATKKIPLQIHHIDGNCLNNKEENLQLLCPNCHSLTENFGKLNKNSTKGRSEYFGRS